MNENKELTLDQSFQKLEELLEKLESPDMPLEESFQVYKQGMDLIKSCNERIDLVEKKVLMLSKDGKVEEF